MTLEELENIFEKYDEDYLEFDKVQNKLSKRRDLHAFLLLDKLNPDVDCIISGSEHDEFFLSIDIENILNVITEDDILELVRCGVIYNDSEMCFTMFS